MPTSRFVQTRHWKLSRATRKSVITFLEHGEEVGVFHKSLRPLVYLFTDTSTVESFLRPNPKYGNMLKMCNEQRLPTPFYEDKEKKRERTDSEERGRVDTQSPSSDY